MTRALLLGDVGWLDAIGRGLREGFFMFWETLWALVLGFTLSGVVQAFVSRRAMQAKLGDHGPAAVARASGYGMASSSCSYAASAMAKSLFVKGADFVAASVFMVASTNLVIELGIVLVVLMGWQFAASEFVGGIIMILALALGGGLFLRGRLVVEARQRLAGTREHDRDQEPEDSALQRAPLATKLRSKAGWVDAASYTIADLTMLRRELVIGFTVAGFLAAVVPSGVWGVLFLHGHGGWTTLENVAVGPLIALASFVCSIGNVPLAAALWQGGISFGGVVSFIFADLISFPLLLVYRRYYGTRLMARMLLVFWCVMSLAGLVTEVMFRAAGLVPAVRPRLVAPAHFSWDYTTYLNIVFLAVFALGYWAYRNRARLGGDGGHAIDVVCGMQVEVANAPAFTVQAGKRLYFCSDRCRVRFEADPGRFAARGAERVDALPPLSVPVTLGGRIEKDEERGHEASREAPDKT
ncbi:MAG: permease [Acidimicrobiales bacterium]